MPAKASTPSCRSASRNTRGAEISQLANFRLPRWLAPALFGGALAFAFWRLPAPAGEGFAPPPAIGVANVDAPMQAGVVPQGATVADSPTLAELPDGRIACAWVAGDDDTRSIVFSTFGAAGWQQPAIIGSRQSAAAGGFAYVGAVGSPVLHAEGGWLHLWFAGSALGERFGSRLFHAVSTDAGASWARTTRMATSPLPISSDLLAAPPVVLADGGLALPISQTALGSQAEVLRYAATGRAVDKLRLPVSGNLYPAIAVLDSARAIAVFSPTGDGAAQAFQTLNGGKTWTPAPALPALARSAPLALLRLNSGKLLLAGNPAGGRQSLQLWLSDDAGTHWHTARTIESAADGAAEFAHPALQQGRDGRIHLAYAARRQAIRHLVFGESWLGAAP